MQDLFGFIIHPMEIGVVWLSLAVNNAGIGIILFTILVRLVLSPLVITQLRNAKAMQQLQPKMAALRQKHGKDRVAQQQALMELYREHNVNPAMGCLPMVVQIPILFGLFYALLHLGNTLPTTFPHSCNGFNTQNASQWFQHCYAISNSPGSTSKIYELFHATFLWMSNGLGQPDPTHILPLLAGATQWVQSRMMLTKSSDPQQQTMNTVTNFMPLMVVVFAWRYASGLPLYWVTSTLVGIAIQYRITGLGLLPEQLGGFKSALTGGGLRSRNGRPPAKPKAPSGQAKQLPPAGSPPSAEPVEPNGSVGTGKDTGTRTAVNRPGKKANRAKGGKSGGRRG